MSSTIGDYLFWKLSTIGVRRVLSRGQSQLFLGSIHRNHLNSVNITHNAIASYSTEIAAFVVSSTSEDLAACYEVGQHNFPQRPAIFIQELDSAETRSATDLVAGLTFATVTVIYSPSTAIQQIDQTIENMLYTNMPVYIGIRPSIAGIVVAVPWYPPSSNTSYTISSGYSTASEYPNAASASVAMSFIH